MPRKKKPKAITVVTVTPKYREEIDIGKLCKALILAARDQAKERANAENKDA